MISPLHLLLVCLAGFVGGFIGSQVGAGSIITLPALLVAGLPLPIAVGTASLSNWLINVAAMPKYWRAGKIHLKFVLPLSVVAAVGAYLGARLLFVVNIALLSKLFAVIFCVLGAAILIKPMRQERAIEALTGWRLWLALGLAFVLGLYGGILAVGLTTFAILAFNLFLKQSQLAAAANAIVLSAVLFTTSTAYFILDRKIDYSLAVPLALTSMIGAYIGANVALSRDRSYFKALLLLVLGLVILKLILSR
jgi:uncharacterized membrane protein YfcA